MVSYTPHTRTTDTDPDTETDTETDTDGRTIELTTHASDMCAQGNNAHTTHSPAMLQTEQNEHTEQHTTYQQMTHGCLDCLLRHANSLRHNP